MEPVVRAPVSAVDPADPADPVAAAIDPAGAAEPRTIDEIDSVVDSEPPQEVWMLRGRPGVGRCPSSLARPHSPENKRARRLPSEAPPGMARAPVTKQSTIATGCHSTIGASGAYG
jgi:hypothetical protein